MAKQPFEEYFDASLGVPVRSEQERREIMEERGLIDARDFGSIEDIHKESERHHQDRFGAKANPREEYEIGRAFERLENGESQESVLRELNGRLRALYGTEENE